MKFILPIMLILSFCGYGQYSKPIIDQNILTLGINPVDITSDNHANFKLTPEQKAINARLDSLFSLIRNTSLQQENVLKDSIKSNNKPSKRRKRMFYNGVMENTPLGQQLKGFVSFSLIGTSNKTVPLWMRSRQFGNIPLTGLSTGIIAGINKSYDPLRTHNLLDWGTAVETRINPGSTIQLVIIEAYLKGRIGIFQFKGGRSKDFIGLVDSTLSSGAFSVSGNALGIPKVELSIPEYWVLPYTKGLIAIKGAFAHGWFGEQDLNPTIPGFKNMTTHVQTYYHELSLYCRFGKPNWRLNLYGGINHEVMWGNESQIYNNYGLSNLKDYLYVVTGKGYYSFENNVQKSRVGNHLGSIDQCIEIKFKNNFLITSYHQFFYDAGALAYLANIKDGLWGLSIKRPTNTNRRFSWNKLLIEFIYSKSQGGEPDSKPRNGAAEDYYNNSLYANGWTYNGSNLGNPLFTSITDARNGLPQTKYEFFCNNRITALHLGTEIEFLGWLSKTLLTYSANYGTWNTAPATRLYGSEIQYNPPPYFPKVDQFSGYFEANHPLKKGYSIGFALAADKGELLNNSVGGFVKITKAW